MSRIKRLLQSYNKYISVPWRDDVAAAQRVIFCIYKENEELIHSGKVNYMFLEIDKATRAYIQPIGK